MKQDGTRLRSPLRHTIVGVTVVSAIACLAVGLWLFRTVGQDDQYLGDVKYIYRWGKPYAMLIDRNRDGFPDYRARINANWGTYPIRILVDEDFDHKYDHQYFLELGRAYLLRIDADGDGYCETSIKGEKADQAYRRWEHDFFLESLSPQERRARQLYEESIQRREDDEEAALRNR